MSAPVARCSKCKCTDLEYIWICDWCGDESVDRTGRAQTTVTLRKDNTGPTWDVCDDCAANWLAERMRDRRTEVTGE